MNFKWVRGSAAIILTHATASLTAARRPLLGVPTCNRILAELYRQAAAPTKALIIRAPVTRPINLSRDVKVGVRVRAI